jgi:WD40 repeat protein
MKLNLALLISTLVCINIVSAQTATKKLINAGDDLVAVAYLPNGNHIVSATVYGKVALWDTTGKKEWETPLDAGSSSLDKSIVHTYAMDVSKDGSELAVAINQARISNGVLQKDDRDAIVIIDSGTGQIRRTLQNGGRHLVFSPNGTLASSLAGGGLAIWNTKTGERQEQLKSLGREVYPQDFSHDGSMIALGLGERSATYMGDDYSTLLIWDSINNRKVAALRTGGRLVTSAKFYPNQSRLAVLSEGPVQMEIFDTHTWKPIYDFPESGLESLTFTSDGCCSASYRFFGDYGKVYIFDNSRRAMKRILDIKPEPKSIAFSPSGKEIAIGRRDGKIVFYGL